MGSSSPRCRYFGICAGCVENLIASPSRAWLQPSFHSGKNGLANAGKDDFDVLNLKTFSLILLPPAMTRAVNQKFAKGTIKTPASRFQQKFILRQFSICWLLRPFVKAKG